MFEGEGCVMRECSDEVRLGTATEPSPWSLVTGRSRVAGRMKELEWSLSDGPMVTGWMRRPWC